MKISILVSCGALALIYAGQASAQDVIPELTASSDVCHSWAYSQTDPTYKASAKKRCHAIVTCMADKSYNQNDLRECLFAAESTFQRETSTGLPQGPSMGIETPATTEVADSAYDHPMRDKGWEYTDQGD